MQLPTNVPKEKFQVQAFFGQGYGSRNGLEVCYKRMSLILVEELSKSLY